MMAQKPQKAPDALAVEARAGAGQRQVLAGKRRPGEVGCARQVARPQRRDIRDDEAVAPPVGGVRRPFARIDVVGEQRPPRGFEAGPSHAAAAEEFVEGVLRHNHRIRERHESLAHLTAVTRRRLTEGIAISVYGAP